MNVVYLTRRNLLTLLAKLDKVRDGGESERMLLKRDTSHSQFPCSAATVVAAVEDEEYYIDREPGPSRDAPSCSTK